MNRPDRVSTPPPSEPSAERKTPSRPPLYALLGTLAYLCFGCAWIFSGQILTVSIANPERVAMFELIKGLTYVGLSGLLVYLLIRFAEPLTQSRPHPDGENPYALAAGQAQRRLHQLPMLVVALMLVAGALVAASLFWWREAALERTEQSTATLQHSVSAHIDTSLVLIELTLREAIADHLADPKSDDRELHNRLPRTSTGVRTLWLLDDEGRVMHDCEGLVTGLQFFGQHFFQQYLTGAKNTLQLGMPQKHPTTGRWFVPASLAMRDTGFRGVAVAIIDVEAFASLWSVHTRRDDLTISLLDKTGQIILRSPFIAEEMEREELAPTQGIKLDDAGTTDFRATSTIDGEHRLFSVGTIAGRDDLRVLVGASERRALNNWRRFAVGGLSLFLFIGAGVFTLLYAIMRELRTRILIQQEAAELARYPLQNRNPVFTVSPLGDWLFINPAAQQMLRELSTEMTGRLNTVLRRLATQPGHHSQELTLGERSYQLSANSHEGRHCDVYMTDITGSRENEALKNAFLAQPFMGMAVSDPVSHEWLLVNERLCQIFGYSESELKGMDWRQLTPPEDLARETLYFEAMMRGDTDGYTLSKRVVRKDGEVIHLELNAHLLRRIDGSPYLIVAAAQDISERVRSQAAQQTLLHDLQERVKELHCVGRIATLLRSQLARDDMLAAAVELLPPAWQYPDITGARIRFDGKTYATANFSETPWRQLSTVRVNGEARGLIEVSYASPQPEIAGGEGPFLAEERTLIDTVAEALGNDIARGETESALATANQRWQYALEGGEHGVWEWRPDTGAVFYSRQWKAMLGYADDELASTLEEWTARVHPDDLARAEAEIERHVRGETDLYQSEHRLRHKDGHYLWILDRGRVVERDAAGKPLLMIGTHTDITARKQMDIALLESEARFKGLVEQSLVGIYMLDAGHILYANPRMCEMLGYSHEEMLRLSPEDITWPEYRPTVRENIRKRLAGEVRSITIACPGCAKTASALRSMPTDPPRSCTAGKSLSAL